MQDDTADTLETADKRPDHDWYSNDTATFGDRLADARAAVGMTQADLARRLGVRTATLDRWENDLSEPLAKRLNLLSGLLNVSLRWLMTGEGEGLPYPDARADLPDGAEDLLTEMRQLQGDVVRIADRIGHLEKAMKAALREAAG